MIMKIKISSLRKLIKEASDEVTGTGQSSINVGDWFIVGSGGAISGAAVPWTAKLIKVTNIDDAGMATINWPFINQGRVTLHRAYSTRTTVANLEETLNNNDIEKLSEDDPRFTKMLNDFRDQKDQEQKGMSKLASEDPNFTYGT